MTNPPDHVARWRGVDIARWSLCAVTILAMHAGAGAYIATRGPVAQAAGSPSAMILEDMLPEVASPSSEPTERPPGPEALKTEDLPEKLAEKPDDEDATTEAVKPAEPEPEAPPAPLASKPEVAVAPPREPEPPKPEVKPVEKKPIALPKRPVPKTKPVKKPVRATTAPQQAQQSKQPRAVQGEASAQSASAAKANWGDRVAAILQRNLRYPPGAERRGVRGLASVRLTVGRSGQMMSASLAGSAGDGELDQEAVSLVRRVSYPPLPEELRGGSYTVTVPVRFK